jgi:hypothetical protein
VAGKRDNYDPARDCELDAAFHLWWQLGDGRLSETKYADSGVIGWAKDTHPDKFEQLAQRFKDAVREVLR